MKKFNPSCSAEERALQAWLILIGAAKNRQTLTYEGLSILMFKKKASGVLSRILGHIASYCDENELPQLNVIVVEKYEGIPGKEIPLEPDKLNKERELVYEKDWYDIFPPSSDDLSVAYQNR